MTESSPAQPEPMEEDRLRVGTYAFRSRLMVGTGKYRSAEEGQRAIAASGAEVVTVALRRVDLTPGGADSWVADLPKQGLSLLPNTAGCYSAHEAVRTARLARELLDTPLVKVEVIGDRRTLFPDVAGTLEASKTLVDEGFVVLPYTNDDPVTAKKLEDIGCAAVMPLAAPIGSGLGIQNRVHLELILDQASVPIIVDAGVGTASDAAVAMELGSDGVLMNTAIAQAQDAVAMAHAMRQAVAAGRLAYRAGRIPKRLFATASSPLEGVIGSKHA